MRIWIFMKWPHGYFELFQRCRYRLFWISMKLSHEVTSWVFWMFKSWRHGYCEYSWSDLMGILNIYEVTSLVFWITKCVMEIFRSWRHGYFEIHIQNYTLNIQNTHDITSRIFQNTHDVSFWIFPWRHFVNIQNSNDVTSWIFKIPHLNIRKLSPCAFWKFMKWCISRSDVMVIHEVNSWGEVNGNLIFMLTSWVFWIFTKWIFMSCHGYFEYSRIAVMGIFKAGVVGILNIHSDIGILNVLEVNIQKTT